MKKTGKYISTDYELEKGSLLEIISHFEKDKVRLRPLPNKQDDVEISDRILELVQIDCSEYGDDIRIDLSKHKIVDSEVDIADDGSCMTITLVGDDRHKLTIKIVNNV